MTEIDKGLIRDYRSIMDHIARTVSSVHGVVTKAENDQVDKLEAQLMNRGLSHAMTEEAVEDYYYKWYKNDGVCEAFCAGKNRRYSR